MKAFCLIIEFIILHFRVYLLFEFIISAASITTTAFYFSLYLLLLLLLFAFELLLLICVELFVTLLNTNIQICFVTLNVLLYQVLRLMESILLLKLIEIMVIELKICFKHVNLNFIPKPKVESRLYDFLN